MKADRQVQDTCSKQPMVGAEGLTDILAGNISRPRDGSFYSLPAR